MKTNLMENLEGRMGETLKKKSKWWIAFSLVVITIGCIFGWNLVRKDSNPANVQGFGVRTAAVQIGEIESSVSSSGSIEISERETIKVTETGEVEEVYFVEGDEVKAGDVLLRFVQEDYSDQIERLESELDDYQDQIDNLETQFKESADDDARESIRTEMEKILEQIADTEEELADLLVEAEEVKVIEAPISGILSSFDIVAGETITAQTNSIGEIINDDQYQVVVPIDELDIPKIKEGQTATIFVEALPDHTYTGTVVSIADEGKNTNGVASFDVTVMLNETTDLKAGMSAEVSIQTSYKEQALLLPIEAVQGTKDQYFVMVPSDSEASETNDQERESVQGTTSDNDSRLRAGGADQLRGQMQQSETDNNFTNTNLIKNIEIGISNEDYVEIVSGLSEGDLVIIPQVTSSDSAQQEDFPVPGNFRNGGFPGGGSGFTGGGGGFTGGQGGGRSFGGR